MKNMVSWRRTLIVGSIFLSFSVGALCVLAFPINQVSLFKDKAMHALGVTHARLFFPETLDTSRYSFSLINKVSAEGTFQLAQVSPEKFFALERFSGELLEFDLRKQGFQSTHLGNIFDQLNFLSNSAASVAGQKIDNAGNKASSKPTIFATAFDIEYAFGRIFMTVTLPSKDQTCTTLNLYSFLPPSNPEGNISDPKSLFSTQCVLDKKNPTMWGGRITHSINRIYLSVGEQRYDPSGFPKNDKLSVREISNRESVFGKVIEFDPRVNKYLIYSSGHRNAQGLFFSNDDQQLIESEHGPFGGDEVNLISKGANYGWPFGTFGKPYPLFNTGNKKDEVRSINPGMGIDKQLASFGAVSGSQPGAQLPIMSWAPGVGAGNITKIQNVSKFVDWRGNIVVSLMADASLHRLILSKNAVVYDERIELGFRVRDFIVNDGGFLILSTDQGRLLFYKTSGVGI